MGITVMLWIFFLYECWAKFDKYVPTVGSNVLKRMIHLSSFDIFLGIEPGAIEVIDGPAAVVVEDTMDLETGFDRKIDSKPLK